MYFFIDNIRKLFYEKDKGRIPTLYNSINWEKSLVVGSFALKSYLEDSGESVKWVPNDIDILVNCKDEKDFDRETSFFESKINCNLLKERYPTSTSQTIATIPANNESDKWNEKFHESIIKTKTYNVENVNEPVQFVGIQMSKRKYSFDTNVANFSVPFEIFLQEIVDIPAVWFKVDIRNNKKIYIIPQKSVEILKTKRGSKEKICESRLFKYTQRGFDFY